MDITFVVETTNGKTWKATCQDPMLEVEGDDILGVTKTMGDMIEGWFVKTFNTTRKVVVKIPTIKAKIKADVSVRPEADLSEFTEENHNKVTTPKPKPMPKLPMPPAPKPEKIIGGACKYISDGKGVLPVGMCEAASNDPSDTPGIRTDDEGVCSGDYKRCEYYTDGGTRVSDPVEVESLEDDFEETSDEDW